MNEQEALKNDQNRLKKIYSDMYSQKHQELSESLVKTIAKTPEYSHEHKKNMFAGGGAGLIGALPGIMKRSPLGAAIGGIAGVSAGAGLGHANTQRKLRRTSDSLVQEALLNSMKREAENNVAIHSYLAIPGMQKVVIKRPWGRETYAG